MKVTIFVNGTYRDYQGDYEELHARDWNERVRDLLDNVHNHETGSKVF